MERILVLLVMCLLVEDGLNDVCSFNEVHTPTNVYSTNHIDVATSQPEAAIEAYTKEARVSAAAANSSGVV